MFVSFLLPAAGSSCACATAPPRRSRRRSARCPRRRCALRADGRVEARRRSTRLRVGDRVRVPLGEAFPADGVLLEGARQVDEALLTGESRPVRKAAGDARRRPAA